MAGDVKFNKWLNDDGTGNSKIRAFVNFDGTGVVAIRKSNNVIGVTDNGVGDYTINFDTPMPDADYLTLMTGDKVSVAYITVVEPEPITKTASSLEVLAKRTDNGTLVDITGIFVAIIDN